MCRSTAEGGQRCAAHTRPGYLAATFGTSEWDEAAADYASTPEGTRVLQDEFENSRNPERSIACFTALSRGAGRREANRETARQIVSAADVTPHFTAETGTNHVYWNRAASSWITTHSLTNVRRDTARAADRTTCLDVASRIATGTVENQVSNGVSGSVTVTHNGRGEGFTVTDRDLKCNCSDYAENYDCEHVRQTVTELNERINQQRVGQRHVGFVLQSEQTLLMETMAANSAVELGDHDTEYADDDLAFLHTYLSIRDRVPNEQVPVDYLTENATGGLGAQDGGRSFGVELEFSGGDTVAIGNELFERGLTRHAAQQHYASGHGTDVMYHQGGWRFEHDPTCSGEIISPIAYDTPEMWENLGLVCDIAVRHGATPGPSSGSHVHVSTGNFGSDTSAYERLLGLYNENEDLLFRLATEPTRGSHRFRGGSAWCYPNNEISSAYSGINGVRRMGGHNNALNFGSVSGSATSNAEFRLWDSTLNAGIIQTQITTSLGMTEAAYRETSYSPLAKRGVGLGKRDFPDDNPDNPMFDTSTKGVRKLADLLFRREENKKQMFGLFMANRWQ